MIKVFISQPMAGKTDAQIAAERAVAIDDIERRLGQVEIIDSYIEEAAESDKPLYWLSKSIELLSQADVAYFCKGWGTARGCMIEHLCALLYDIEMIHR